LRYCNKLSLFDSDTNWTGADLQQKYSPVPSTVHFLQLGTRGESRNGSRGADRFGIPAAQMRPLQLITRSMTRVQPGFDIVVRFAASASSINLYAT
jgi:hypothetical protein